MGLSMCSMRRRQPLAMFLTVLAALGLALLSACGGGGGTPTPNPVVLRTLGLTLSGFTAYVGQRAEIYVADTGNFLWFTAIYDPLPAASVGISCPKSLSAERSYEASIWADVDGDGSRDASPTDNSWVASLSAAGTLAFAPSASYTDFNPASFNRDGRSGDFIFNASGLDAALVGRGFEARVIDTKSGRTVGLYHLGAVPGASFNVTVPDIINGSTYQVDFYVDANGSGGYNAPPTDQAWRRTVTTTGTQNLVVDFAYDTTFTNIAL
jgi:hypothetical protein